MGPFSSLAVFTEAPLCPGPGAAALNETDTPGCKAFVQELHGHLQNYCEGGARLRLWEHGQASRRRWGWKSSREATARRNRRNWGNMSGKGGCRRLQRAAGSEHEGPASHVERGKGLHSVPLASSFPICEETASASGGPLTESIRKMVMS